MWRWLRSHPYEKDVLAFLLMALPPIPIYFAAQRDFTAGIWLLLLPILLGNLLALFVK